MTPIYALVARSFYAGAAPVLTTASSSIVDPLGGDSLTLAGTSLSGVLAIQLSSDSSFTTGVTTFTGIAGNTATQVTGTTPTSTAGTVYVRAQTSAGYSNSLALESWYPFRDAVTPTLMCEEPNYSYNSGTTVGQFTGRYGSASSPNATGNAPTTINGSYPVFDGSSTWLGGNNVEAIFQSGGGSSGTFAFVVQPTSAPAGTGTGISENSMIGDVGRGAIGLLYTTRTTDGSPGFSAILTDGTYKTARAPAAAGQRHVVVMRFADSTTLDLCVDGLKNSGLPGIEQTAMGTYSAGTGQVFAIGKGWASNYYGGGMQVIATAKDRASNVWLGKFIRWSQHRHAVAAPSLGVAQPMTLSVSSASTSGGTSVTITGFGMASLTTLKFDNSSQSFSSNTATSVTFTTPAKTAGDYAIVLTNATGDSVPLYLKVA